MTLTVEQVCQALETLDAKIDEASSAYNSEMESLSAKKQKLKAWLWANAEHTADSITEEYVKLRDDRAILKKDYDTKDDVLKSDMEARENWLLAKLNEVGADSFRTEHGTAYIQTKTRSSCSDWTLLWDYIAENKRFDLLEKRVSQAPISKMIEAGETLPPAINIFSERVVTVRRS